MNYVLRDLDTGSSWTFSDIYEARAYADQLSLHHWLIVRGVDDLAIDWNGKVGDDGER